MRSSVRFSDGLTPKAGAACAMRPERGSDARLRSGYWVLGPPPRLPWALTASSVEYESPNSPVGSHQTRRSRLSSAFLDSTAT